ncbi:NAD(P)H-binding protein [Microlunatus speluncae]|uniref:NAD(P)H-binding protein n=1 Tax=Microlunatus speluncae TaxID=2594267 RepID=UPI0012663FE6|nr:NAD(P)H-binding protein [Microlunatus speluncae]
MTRVLVTGASGFIGSHLCAELVAGGHTVRAMTRRPDDYAGAGEPIAGDVSDPDSLEPGLAGADAAYYLVHALGSDDFVERDAEAARAFGEAAARAGVGQLIYLGGLGVDDGRLSDHLRSRREVEGLLAGGGVPVTTLRAAIVIGHDGISWELTRQLAQRLPAMITPAWVSTRTQPIALVDMIRYLVGVLGRPETYGSAYDVGGPEVLSYGEMLRRVAKIIDGRPLPMLPVPLLTPRLSSAWLQLITDVDPVTARNLIGSMSNEVVVRDDRIRRLIPGDQLGYDDAVRAALIDCRRAGESW